MDKFAPGKAVPLSLENLGDAINEIVRLRDANRELISAINRLIEAAQFGNDEQSPPGYWDKDIEFAKQCLTKHGGQ